MKQQISLFSLIYFPITALVGLLWVEISEFQNIVFFALWQLVMAKVVYDVIWLVMAWFSKDDIPQKLSSLSETPSVALLYTCRDDILDISMKGLVDQDYPNYDIYILDDSQKEQSKERVDQFANTLNIQGDDKQVTVLRRNSIEGYKAGNLNNWLTQFGYQYKYFVVFDNDSLAPQDFITQLVQYAEHPDNKHIAIFQSTILPWNGENYFVRWIGAVAPMSMMILKRNSNRTGTAISFGHNNLQRISAFEEVGGFNQELTSEDTAATFELDVAGYKTRIVDIVSYESEPANILKYKRRAVRWAAQTLALFGHPWEQVTGALKLELSRLMLYYIINIIFLFWVIGSIWYFDGNLSLKNQFNQITALGLDFYPVYLVSFILILSLLVSNFVIHFILAVKCKVPILDYLGHLLVSTAIFFFTIVPITLAILEGILGKKVKYKPSNIDSGSISLWELINNMKIVWGASLIALLQYFFNQKLPWNYLGGLWAILVFITPIFLLFAHKYPVTGVDYYVQKESSTPTNKKNIFV